MTGISKLVSCCIIYILKLSVECRLHLLCHLVFKITDTLCCTRVCYLNYVLTPTHITCSQKVPVSNFGCNTCQLPCRFFMVFLRSCRQILGQQLKLSCNCFLHHSFQFSIKSSKTAQPELQRALLNKLKYSYCVVNSVIFIASVLAGVVNDRGKTYGIYAVSVAKHYETGYIDKWHVYRRYSDFHDLHQKVKDKVSMLRMTVLMKCNVRWSIIW